MRLKALYIPISLLFLLLFVVAVPVQSYFSITLETQKCRKIPNREERNHCLAKIHAGKNQKEQPQKEKENSIKKKNINLEKSCKNIKDAKQRVRCFAKVHEENIKKKKYSENKNQELFLRIIPCEKKKTRQEKILCYHSFHVKRLKKEEEAKKVSKSKQKKYLLSPTLQLLRCKKISERSKRSTCYINIKKSNREIKEQKYQQEKWSYNESEEHRACLRIRSGKRQKKCFHKLSQKEKRIFNGQDSTFQPEDVRSGE